MRRLLLALVTPVCLWLAGCDLLGIEGATVVAERKAAEGKAVGAACRHAGRAIEDCYTLNKKADKASIYAGWREMDDYMRENKLEAVVPTLTPAPTPRKTAEADDAASDAGGDKTAKAPSAKIEKIARIDKSAAEKPSEH